MRLDEIDGRDINAYTLSIPDKEESTGNFSKDYKIINDDYLTIKAKCADTKSKNDKRILLNDIDILMNKIYYIDNICVLTINHDKDSDAIQIKTKLDNIHNDLTKIQNSIK